MPKDEFDFDDPMELQGVGILTEEDTSGAMCECFIEEFMRMGFPPSRILALFHNPYYIGMNMVLLNRGEAFVKQFITDTFARWGRPVDWSVMLPPAVPVSQPAAPSCASTREAVDPMGNVVPPEILGGSQ